MGLIMTVLILLTGLISTVLGELFASEAKAWLPHLVERLVCRAVAKLPLDQQDRLAEEWRADLDGVPGNIGRLWVACGFQVAASEIVDGPVSSRVRKLVGYVIDVSVAVILLVLCAPLMVLVSIVIKVESSGPVLVSIRRKDTEGYEYRATRFRTRKISVPENEEVLDDLPSCYSNCSPLGWGQPVHMTG